MAITLGQAIFFLRGDRGDLDKTIGEAEKDTKGVVGRMNDFLGGAGKIALGAVAVGATALTAAVAKGASEVIGYASQARANVTTLQTSLGLSREEAQKLGDVSRAVFANNFGADLNDANDALLTVRKTMRGLADEDLQHATENAFRLKDVFGTDIPESTAAAATLMDKFGLSQEQAFDFITKGMQAGLDTSGDFLDTINEYSTQFANAGNDAGQFFSILETGAQNGVLGTDKIADAFKESRLIISEMSDTTIEAFKDIGNQIPQISALNAEFASGATDIAGVRAQFKEYGIDLRDDAALMIQNGESITSVFGTEVANAVEKGSLSIADAQQIAIEGLQNMDDGVRKANLSVKLFGTQAEDLGPSFVNSLDLAKTGIDDLAGSTADLDAKYNNFPSLFEGFKRKALDAFEPLGAAVLDLGGRAMPYLADGMTKVSDGLVWIIDKGKEFANNLPSWDQVVAGARSVGDTLSWLGGIFGDVFNGYQAIVDSVIGAVGGVFSSHSQEIDSTFGTTFTNIKTYFTVAMELYRATVPPVLQAIAGFIRAHGTEIGMVFKATFDLIFGIINTVLGLATGVIQAFIALARGDWEGFGTALQSIADTALNGVLGIVKSVLNIVLGIFGTTIDDIGIKVTNGFNGVKNAVTGALTEMAQRVDDTLGGIPSKMIQLGGDIVSGLISGLTGAAGKLYSYVSNLVGGIFSRAKDEAESHSPSARSARLGVDIVQGLMNGMESLRSDLLSTAGKLVDDLMAKYEDAVKEGQKTIGSLLDTMAGGSRFAYDIQKTLDSLVLGSNEAKTARDKEREATEKLAEAQQKVASISQQIYGEADPAKRADLQKQAADALKAQVDAQQALTEAQGETRRIETATAKLEQLRQGAMADIARLDARADELGLEGQTRLDFIQNQSKLITESANLQKQILLSTDQREKELLTGQLALLEQAIKDETISNTYAAQTADNPFQPLYDKLDALVNVSADDLKGKNDLREVLIQLKALIESGAVGMQITLNGSTLDLNSILSGLGIAQATVAART